MIEDREWTPTLLAYELVADLESLQGVRVEWERKWPFTEHHYAIWVATNPNKVYTVDISVTESVEP